MGKPPKSVPSVVQLPGGIRLQAVPFKVTEHNEDGSPRLFEIMPHGSRGDWYLFADEETLRAPRSKPDGES